MAGQGNGAAIGGANGSGKPHEEEREQAHDAAPAGEVQPPAGPDPEIMRKVATLRAQVRENFGKITMAMMMLPRYRHQTLAYLQHLVLEPLIRDRIAIAYPAKAETDPLADIAGLAIWASVTDEADARIREQIRAGIFPIRLKPEDWTAGPNHWLLDVIAQDTRTTATVIANFRQLVKEGSLKMHPIITRLVDAETLKKMGAVQMGRGTDSPAAETTDHTATNG